MRVRKGLNSTHESEIQRVQVREEISEMVLSGLRQGLRGEGHGRIDFRKVEKSFGLTLMVEYRLDPTSKDCNSFLMALIQKPPSFCI